MTGQLKQGPDRKVYEPKREPKSHAVSPGAVSRLGNMVGEGTPHKTLYKDDGTLQAPMHSVATHKGGSQGRY
jgi:hypothetical protein